MIDRFAEAKHGCMRLNNLIQQLLLCLAGPSIPVTLRSCLSQPYARIKTLADAETPPFRLALGSAAYTFTLYG